MYRETGSKLVAGIQTNDGTLAIQFHVPSNIKPETDAKRGSVKTDRLMAGFIGDFLK